MPQLTQTEMPYLLDRVTAYLVFRKIEPAVSALRRRCTVGAHLVRLHVRPSGPETHLSAATVVC